MKKERGISVLSFILIALFVVAGVIAISVRHQQDVAMEKAALTAQQQQLQAEEAARAADKERRAAEAERLAAEERAALEKAIVDKKVVIGMTKEQVIRSWGEPNDVNSSIGEYGRHEQWIYNNGDISLRQYLYIDNGVLKSIQSPQ